MRIISNKILPVKGFSAINLLGFVFTRLPADALPITTKRHEAIHTAQQYEILALSALISLVLCNIFASWWYLLACVIMPLAIYLLAWIVELLLPPYDSAYKDSLFEREAYANSGDPDYLVNRSPFAWISYFLKFKER